MFAVQDTRNTRTDVWVVPLSVGRDGPQAGRPEPLLQPRQWSPVGIPAQAGLGF